MKINNRGFTLVELNLSMLFVALLILGVAMTTLQVSRMYQKGITVKTVNQVGREVVEQLRRDFSTANQSVLNLDEVGVGRMCLGSVSYLFNNAVILNGSPSLGIKNPSGQKVVLTRVIDSTASYCQRDGGGSFVKPNIVAGDDFTELLATDTISLAIHNLEADEYLEGGSGSVKQALYGLVVGIGTNEVDTTSTDETTICKPPTDGEANFESCFVTEFEIVVRAGEITQ